MKETGSDLERNVHSPQSDGHEGSLLYAPRRLRVSKGKDRIWLHVALFLATLFSTIWAGVSLIGRDLAYDAGGWSAILVDGLLYAVPFITFLTVHEFGHYLMARRHKLDVSLPYFIPVPLPGSIGTFGAVIRIREPLRRTRQLFNVGAAGPLAGFVVALGVLLLGAATLPPVSYLLSVSGHESVVATVQQTGSFPPLDLGEGGMMALIFGDTPLFHVLMEVAPYRPADYEMVHYPLLVAGWLGLFFTALNLLPVGQLDGGHVVYALFGPSVHAVVARATTLVLLLSGSIGFLVDIAPVFPASESAFDLILPWLFLGLLVGGACWKIFDDPFWAILAAVVVASLSGAVSAFLPGVAEAVGWWGWMLWIGLILFVIRIDHPPVLVHESLTPKQRLAGYLCMVIFLLCFSIKPITVV